VYKGKTRGDGQVDNGEEVKEEEEKEEPR